MLASFPWSLAPHAHEAYRAMLANPEPTLKRFGIDTNLRLLHFLAQTLHETGGFTILIENLNYSAERLCVVWPTRFPTIEKAKPFAYNPRALANFIYGGRMGNLGLNDGWWFRGRGLLQITGRHNYQRVSNETGKNFLLNPDLVLHPDYGLMAAACFWQLAGGNEAADADDLVRVTKVVNGGTIGLADREAWLVKAQGYFTTPGQQSA